MSYRPDTLIEKALKFSASSIAESRIKRADEGREWTMGRKTTKADKRKWIATAYFAGLHGLIEELGKLEEQMKEYVKENR